MSLTHLNIAEQEAAAYAIGLLKDTKSIKKIKKLYQSSTNNVQIAAARSLYLLGDSDAKEFLLTQAKNNNLFAIVALADVPEGKEVLATLCASPDLLIRINAAFSLIRHHDPRSLPPLMEILIRDHRDLGVQPSLSLGKTLMAFKPVFSCSHQKNQMYDLKAANTSLREQLLKEMVQFPESDFLKVAEEIFNHNQTELVPTLVHLLETLQTEGSVALLIRKAQEAGMPLIRTYCNLTLYRLGKEGPYEEFLKDWIARNKDSELIRFKPQVPIDKQTVASPHELTLEDNSRILIDIYQTLAEKQRETSLDILLRAMRDGNQKNRYVLAGLLLRALQ
jgi:hypothetical protein